MWTPPPPLNNAFPSPPPPLHSIMLSPPSPFKQIFGGKPRFLLVILLADDKVHFGFFCEHFDQEDLQADVSASLTLHTGANESTEGKPLVEFFSSQLKRENVTVFYLPIFHRLFFVFVFCFLIVVGVSPSNYSKWVDGHFHKLTLSKHSLFGNSCDPCTHYRTSMQTNRQSN